MAEGQMRADMEAVMERLIQTEPALCAGSSTSGGQSNDWPSANVHW